MKVKILVVGAGPAGIAAAYTLAKHGVEVLVLERGKYPGSKNVSGGVLYTPTLSKLIPDFYQDAPLERAVLWRKWALLSGDHNREMTVEFKSQSFSPPLYNQSFTVLRAKFDLWFAQKAEDAGAMIACDMMAEKILLNHGQVVGVKVKSGAGEEDVFCDILIAADGVNSLLAQQAGLKSELSPESTALAVKEIIELPDEIIDRRFGLERHGGAAYEYVLLRPEGTIALGFIYTNKGSLSVGLGMSIKDLARKGLNPHDLLEEFKKIPAVEMLIRDGNTKEYAAHLIFEGGYDEISKLYGNGILVAGEAAGLVNNSFYLEGSNLAMESGMLAGLAAVRALELKDASAEILSFYKDLLKKSFVLRDLKKFNGMGEALRGAGFAHKAEDFLASFEEILRIDSSPKEDHLEKARKILFQDCSWFQIAKGLISAKRWF